MRPTNDVVQVFTNTDERLAARLIVYCSSDKKDNL